MQENAAPKNGSLIVIFVSVTVPVLVIPKTKSTMSPTAEKVVGAVLSNTKLAVRAGPAAVIVVLSDTVAAPVALADAVLR